MFIPEKKYKEILKSIPIACVDLLVINDNNKILLVKRLNEPAKGQWWFPGGRVHFGETREDAAIRKLKEEIGIIVKNVKMLNTFDLILHYGKNELSHAITTIFKVQIKNKNINLDNQSEEYFWKYAYEWFNLLENKFVIKVIKSVTN